MSLRSSVSLLQAFSITAGCSDPPPPPHSCLFECCLDISDPAAFLPVLIPPPPPPPPPSSSSGWSVAAVWTEEMRTVSLSPQLPPGSRPNWSWFGLSGCKESAVTSPAASAALWLSAITASLHIYSLIPLSLCILFCVNVPFFQFPGVIEHQHSFLLCTAMPCFTFTSYHMFTLGAAQYNQSFTAGHWELPSTDQLESHSYL